MRKLPKTLTELEFSKLLKATYKEHHKLAFQLGFFCGLRVSEVVKLQPDHVDWSMGWLHILEAKGMKDRDVPYPKRLSTRLKKQLPLHCGVRSLQIAFKKALDRAGIKKPLTFHSLRHSCGTLWIQKGKSVKHVQQLLGHSNITTTNIYLHITPEDLKKEMDDLWD